MTISILAFKGKLNGKILLLRFFFCRVYFNEVVLISTHNLCFRAKIRKNVYPCKPQFYYIKVGCKRVNITRTCYHDTTRCNRFVLWQFLYNKYNSKTDFLLYLVQDYVLFLNLYKEAS